jgi:hypothetical protein
LPLLNLLDVPSDRDCPFATVVCCPLGHAKGTIHDLLGAISAPTVGGKRILITARQPKIDQLPRDPGWSRAGEDWAEIRRLRRSEGMAISQIARVMGISRNTVKVALASDGPPK